MLLKLGHASRHISLAFAVQVPLGWHRSAVGIQSLVPRIRRRLADQKRK